MPLPNRTTHEKALTAAITAEYDSLIAQAKANPSSVNWTASEDEAQRDAADEIATVYLLSLSGLSKQTQQDFNQYVAIALATDYANQRSSEVVSNLYSDLRANVNQAASSAARSVAEGIPADEAKRRYEAELARIFEPIRPDTIGVTEVTAAISAGEYAVGKPDKNRWWLALLLLYGAPNALEAWRNGNPGQPIRDLIGRPRMPRRRGLDEPAPPEWPTPTPRRELPIEPELPGQGKQPSGQENPQAVPPIEQPPKEPVAPVIPSVLFPYWVTEGDSKVCPICAPLDGAPEDQYWNISPGGPPVHVNCRCTLRWARFEEVDG